MNAKAVAFGRVVRGMGLIRKIGGVACVNERPEEPIKVEKAGRVDLNSVHDLKLT